MRFIAEISRFIRFTALAPALVLAGASSLHAKEVEEKFDDGTVHLHYQTDAVGRKEGDFKEFAQGGGLKIQGTYSADKKTGQWTTFDGQGKPSEVAHWREGILEGPYQLVYPSGRVHLRTVYRAGDFLGPITTCDEQGHILVQVSYPHPLAEVERMWNTLAPLSRDAPKFVEEPKTTAPYVAGKMAEESLTAAAKYAMLYRWMCGLPQQNLRVDPGLCNLAQHGAVVLAALGKLSHTPEQPPDMDEAFFKLGYAGCHQSNLNEGTTTLFDAIDSFMDDSDGSNVKKIGHRQWILSPGLQRTGFGSVREFAAMHVISAGPGGNNYTFVAYPGPGYYPTAMLGSGPSGTSGTPWSVHLNLSKIRVASADEVKVSVESLDDHFALGEESEGTVVNILPNNYANWTSIIFRPGRTALPPGKYLVKIDGVRAPGGIDLPFSYLVDLCELPPPQRPDALPH